MGQEEDQDKSREILNGALGGAGLGIAGGAVIGALGGRALGTKYVNEAVLPTIQKNFTKKIGDINRELGFDGEVRRKAAEAVQSKNLKNTVFAMDAGKFGGAGAGAVAGAGTLGLTGAGIGGYSAYRDSNEKQANEEDQAGLSDQQKKILGMLGIGAVGAGIGAVGGRKYVSKFEFPKQRASFRAKLEAINNEFASGPGDPMAQTARKLRDEATDALMDESSEITTKSLRTGRNVGATVGGLAGGTIGYNAFGNEKQALEILIEALEKTAYSPSAMNVFSKATQGGFKASKGAHIDFKAGYEAMNKNIDDITKNITDYETQKRNSDIAATTIGVSVAGGVAAMQHQKKKKEAESDMIPKIAHEGGTMIRNLLEQMEHLAKTDPVAFEKVALEVYDELEKVAVNPYQVMQQATKGATRAAQTAGKAVGGGYQKAVQMGSDLANDAVKKVDDVVEAAAATPAKDYTKMLKNIGIGAGASAVGAAGGMAYANGQKKKKQEAEKVAGEEGQGLTDTQMKILGALGIGAGAAGLGALGGRALGNKYTSSMVQPVLEGKEFGELNRIRHEGMEALNRKDPELQKMFQELLVEADDLTVERRWLKELRENYPHKGDLIGPNQDFFRRSQAHEKRSEDYFTQNNAWRKGIEDAEYAAAEKVKLDTSQALGKAYRENGVKGRNIGMAAGAGVGGTIGYNAFGNEKQANEGGPHMYRELLEKMAALAEFAPEAFEKAALTLYAGFEKTAANKLDFGNAQQRAFEQEGFADAETGGVELPTIDGSTPYADRASSAQSDALMGMGLAGFGGVLGLAGGGALGHKAGGNLGRTIGSKLKMAPAMEVGQTFGNVAGTIGGMYAGSRLGAAPGNYMKNRAIEGFSDEDLGAYDADLEANELAQIQAVQAALQNPEANFDPKVRKELEDIVKYYEMGGGRAFAAQGREKFKKQASEEMHLLKTALYSGDPVIAKRAAAILIEKSAYSIAELLGEAGETAVRNSVKAAPEVADDVAEEAVKTVAKKKGPSANAIGAGVAGTAGVIGAGAVGKHLYDKNKAKQEKAAQEAEDLEILKIALYSGDPALAKQAAEILMEKVAVSLDEFDTVNMKDFPNQELGGALEARNLGYKGPDRNSPHGQNFTRTQEGVESGTGMAALGGLAGLIGGGFAGHAGGKAIMEAAENSRNPLVRGIGTMAPLTGMFGGAVGGANLGIIPGVKKQERAASLLSPEDLAAYDGDLDAAYNDIRSKLTAAIDSPNYSYGQKKGFLDMLGFLDDDDEAGMAFLNRNQQARPQYAQPQQPQR